MRGLSNPARRRRRVAIDAAMVMIILVLMVQMWLLTATLEDATAREWVLQRKLRPEEVTTIFAGELTAWMTEMAAEDLATRLTGGVTLAELPADVVTAAAAAGGSAVGAPA